MERKVIKLYYNKIVKNSKFFFVFVVLGITAFLIFTINIRISVIETFDGSCAENRLIINEVVDYPIKKAYAYKGRSEKVISCECIRSEVVDDSYTILFVDGNEDELRFDGPIKIDVEKEEIPLFLLIFNQQKRYVEKDER